MQLKVSEKAKVFISSRNRFSVNKWQLSDIRRELRDRIPKWFPFLEVLINEDFEARPGTPLKLTEEISRRCHLFIGILVDGQGGYKDKMGLTATEIEFKAAMDSSLEKMLVFVHHDLRPGSDLLEQQSERYKQLIESLVSYREGMIVKWFRNGTELQKAVQQAIAAYCGRGLKALRSKPDRDYTTRTETLWELMTFSQRRNAIRQVFQAQAETIHLHDSPISSLEFLKDQSGRIIDGQEHADLYRMTVRAVDQDEPSRLPVFFSVCPDRFSYPDAARFVGYPFRKDVEDWKEDLGPLHLIMVFRTITDTQIRRHLGNPDIHVAKKSWGFYAADPERFIQVVYLTNCYSPQRLVNKVSEFLAWLEQYELIEELIERARDRGRILKARSRPPVSTPAFPSQHRLPPKRATQGSKQKTKDKKVSQKKASGI